MYVQPGSSLYIKAVDAKSDLPAAVISATGANNQLQGFSIAKNGVVDASTLSYATTGTNGRSENVKVLGIALLQTGDYLELFVQNNSSTNSITVTDTAIIISAIN